MSFEGDSSRCTPPHLVEDTSAGLLRRAGGGDESAWRLLMHVDAPVVRYWCQRAGLNRADRGEVFSETSLAVFKSLPNFERAEGNSKFRAWLKKITRSKMTDHFARQHKQANGYGGTTALAFLSRIESDEEIGGFEEEQDPSLAHSEETFVVQRLLKLIEQEFRPQTWNAFCLVAFRGLSSTEAEAELESYRSTSAHVARMFGRGQFVIEDWGFVICHCRKRDCVD